MGHCKGQGWMSGGWGHGHGHGQGWSMPWSQGQQMQIPMVPAPMVGMAAVMGFLIGMLVGKKKAMMHGMGGHGMWGHHHGMGGGRWTGGPCGPGPSGHGMHGMHGGPGRYGGGPMEGGAEGGPEGGPAEEMPPE